MPAHERAVERGCEAMQVFNQSPRAWRPTRWKPDDVAEFLSLRKDSPVKSVTIHAVYLINPATKDREMRKKSADSLIHALRMGDEIRADGVVLHPGSTVGEPQEEALPRVGEMVRHALSESDGCRLLLENTAGAGNTIGRSFEELRELIDLAGGDKRIGICLDSCHMFASGFDITTADKLDRGDRQLREGRRHAPAQVPARERLAHRARLEPRPPRPARRRRDRPARLRGLPVGAALREAAGALRGPGRERPRPREGRRGQDEEAARERACAARKRRG